MTAVGKATVTIDDAALKARMRDLLAQAWDEGWDAGHFCGGPKVYPICKEDARNPYRDEADA